jgi:hypothetical protein
MRLWLYAVCWDGSSCTLWLHGADDSLDPPAAAWTLGAYVLPVVVEGDGLLGHGR